MKYKKLNIDPELVGYAKIVRDRDGIPYKVAADGTLKAKLDDEGEEILIEDAMCERQRADADSEFPVYSYRTMCNEEKFGYVPEKDNVVFSWLMDAGKLLTARITYIKQRGRYTQVYIKIFLVDF